MNVRSDGDAAEELLVDVPDDVEHAGDGREALRDVVSAGDAASVLTTVVSLDKVHVHFDADERAFLRYAEMARKGERPSERDGKVPVQVALADESDFPHAGVVDFLDNQVDRSTGTIRARAVLDNADRVFTPGLYARVRLLGSGEFKAALVDDKMAAKIGDDAAIWRQVACPVLWVAGAESTIPKWLDAHPEGEMGVDGLDGVRRRMTAIRDARLVVIPDAGHMLHHDRPDAVARAIESFLDAP